MPNRSYADHFRHLETLLQRTKARHLPTAGASELRAALQENLRESRRALWRMQTARIEERQLRRMKQEHIETGRDLAARLRHAVRAILGPYNERLARFGIAPLRRRRRGREAG